MPGLTPVEDSKRDHELVFAMETAFVRYRRVRLGVWVFWQGHGQIYSLSNMQWGLPTCFSCIHRFRYPVTSKMTPLQLATSPIYAISEMILSS